MQALAQPLLFVFLALGAAGPGGSANAPAGEGEKTPADPAAPADAEELLPRVASPDQAEKASDEGAAAAGAKGDEAPGLLGAFQRVHGRLDLRYRGRRTSTDTDQDLYGVLTLDAGDETRDPITYHFSGRASFDLDGLSSDDPSSPFFSITDTYGSRLNGHLYEAYADVHSIDGVHSLKVGRQDLVETPELAWFDGLYAESDEDLLHARGLQLGAYGGIPVHFFEDSPEGDGIWGTFAQGRPWKGGRVRFDWMHFQDESFLGKATNDLLHLGVWQHVREGLDLEGAYGHLDGAPRDVRLTGNAYDLEEGWNVRVSYYELLETEKLQSLEIDPLYGTLLTYFPYRQVGILGTKDFGKHFELEGGADVRRVSDGQDVGEFNRDFEHYHATTSFLDVAGSGVDASLTGDVWKDSQNDVQTWGADVSKELDTALELSVGSYYSLYKYELFQLSERNNVRSYFVRLRRRATDHLGWNVAFEYEDDDIADYQVLTVGTTWRF